jgi:hypothetical protein
MKEGVIFIIPSAFHDGSFKVILPLVFLHCLNSKYAIFPYRLDEIFEKNWEWKSFEEWDCKYQLIKNNAWLWLSRLANIQNFRTDLGTLYSCKHPDSRYKQLSLCDILDIAQETEHFLKKDINKTNLPQNTISTNLGQISKEYFIRFSFRCCAGNPSVDSRVYYKELQNDEIQKPWMICKQYKHSVKNTKLSLEKMNKAYFAWEKRIDGYIDYYRCFYVLITNQFIDQNDIDEFEKRKSVAVVCRNNFGSYCPIGFSVYSIFDDDPYQLEEEMLTAVDEINISSTFLNNIEDEQMIDNE